MVVFQISWVQKWLKINKFLYVKKSVTKFPNEIETLYLFQNELKFIKFVW